MSKQTYTVNKGKPLTKCTNCDRLIADHQIWMHGKGLCSIEATELELKKAKILKK